MNSWKLNGIVGSAARVVICQGLSINQIDLYKKVKDITIDGVITTNENKIFQLKLELINKK